MGGWVKVVLKECNHKEGIHCYEKKKKEEIKTEYCVVVRYLIRIIHSNQKYDCNRGVLFGASLFIGIISFFFFHPPTRVINHLKTCSTIQTSAQYTHIPHSHISFTFHLRLLPSLSSLTTCQQHCPTPFLALSSSATPDALGISIPPYWPS